MHDGFWRWWVAWRLAAYLPRRRFSLVKENETFSLSRSGDNFRSSLVVEGWFSVLSHLFVQLFQQLPCPAFSLPSAEGIPCTCGMVAVDMRGFLATQVYILLKSTRHPWPVLRSQPFGTHKERKDIGALGSHGGSDIFDITVCHSLIPARIRDGLEYPLTQLNNAWDEKIRTFRRVLHATVVKLFPMPISNLGGKHPDAHRAVGTIAVDIASRTLSSLHYACATLFHRHAALLVANNAVCLMSGFDFEV